MNKVKIHLHNFKCFEDTTLYLNNITFLTGANASGKSSFIQALLLADSALMKLEKDKGKVQIPLCDSQRALDLGKVDNLINERGDDEVSIHINETKLEFSGVDEVPDGFLLMRHNNSEIDSENGLGYIYYLNAERIGPRQETELTKNMNKYCGCHGEHTATVILNNEFTKISAKKCYGTKETGESNFRIVLDSWIHLIFPDIIVRVVATGNTKCQVMINNKKLGIENTATNVGFGISYVLPILVTCLLAKEKETVIIENPEAHLHAKAQSNMGYFLGVMAAAGLRIIVETHSEHIINGIRRTIACTNLLNSEAVTIYFFETEENNIQQTEINIDKDGNLSKFPIDFFDQQRQDSLAIFESLH